MSTIVGGGMVSIPWAFYQSGIIIGLVVSVLASTQVILSSILFLKARSVCPDRPQSMFEMGFLILGRASIYWISFIIFVNSFGLLIIFFNVFGETTKATMTNIFWADVDTNTPNFGMKRECWIISLAVCLLPFVLMKELAELKAVSIALFSAAIVFVLMNVFQFAARGNSLSNFDDDYSAYFQPTFDKNFIQSLAIMFTACNF
jgi:amino acid permease